MYNKNHTTLLCFWKIIIFMLLSISVETQGKETAHAYFQVTQIGEKHDSHLQVKKSMVPRLPLYKKSMDPLTKKTRYRKIKNIPKIFIGTESQIQFKQFSIDLPQLKKEKNFHPEKKSPRSFHFKIYSAKYPNVLNPLPMIVINKNQLDSSRSNLDLPKELQSNFNLILEKDIELKTSKPWDEVDQALVDSHQLIRKQEFIPAAAILINRYELAKPTQKFLIDSQLLKIYSEARLYHLFWDRFLNKYQKNSFGQKNRQLTEWMEKDINLLKTAPKSVVKKWLNQRPSLTLAAALYIVKSRHFTHLINNFSDWPKIGRKEHQDNWVYLEFLHQILKNPTSISSPLELEINSNQLIPSLKNHYLLLQARSDLLGKKYASSLKLYDQFDPDISDDWYSVLMERTWLQFRKEQFNKVVGNMYSMHTPTFDYYFNPETYLYRSAGYVKLCQFGDALKTLKNFHKKFSPLKKALKKDYSKEKYYSQIKYFLKSEKQVQYNGMPKTIVFHLAQSPQFIDIQEKINNIDAEKKVILLELKKSLDKESTSRKNKRDFVKKFRNKKEKGTLSQGEKKNYHSTVARFNSEHRKNMLLRKNIKRILARTKIYHDQIISSHKKDIENILAKRFTQTRSQMIYYFEQMDLLALDIYSKAGLSLRKNPEREGQTPRLSNRQKTKTFKWETSDEIWTDELGQYHSNIANLCLNKETKNAASKNM